MAKDKVATKTLKSVITPEEQMVIKLASNLSGKSIGVYAKDIVVAQARKDLKASGIEPANLKPGKK